MTRKQNVIIILILGALSTVSPFAIDMYLPGFPAIAADLGTTIDQVQLSLTGYLIGIAVGQLIYGPLLDRFGRKKPLYIGLSIYILASLACAATGSVKALIIMRFFQAIGGCAGLVAAQALVRDLFPVNKAAQAFSSITLVVAVSPMIAPTIGGHVTTAFSWHWVFIILASVTSLIFIAVHFVLPRGRRPDPSISLLPKAVVNNFYTVIKQHQFLVYAITSGIATSAPFAYIAGSSDVFMNIYHVSGEEYGWIFAFIGGTIIASTQLNHILLKRFRSEQIIRMTLIYQVCIGSIMVIGTWLGWYDKYSLIGIMILFLIGQGWVNPNGTALALAPFTKHAGSAAALLGSFRMAMGGIVSASVSALHNNTALPMVGMMAACAVLGLIVLTLGKSAVRYHARRKDVEKDTSPLL